MARFDVPATLQALQAGISHNPGAGFGAGRQASATRELRSGRRHRGRHRGVSHRIDYRICAIPIGSNQASKYRARRDE